MPIPTSYPVTMLTPDGDEYEVTNATAYVDAVYSRGHRPKPAKPAAPARPAPVPSSGGGAGGVSTAPSATVAPGSGGGSGGVGGTFTPKSETPTTGGK